MAELSGDELSTLAERFSSFVNGLADAEREFLADVLATAGAGESAEGEADVEGFGLRRSDRTQQAIFAMEQAINRQEMGMVVGPNDRRRASMDNIQKFLDITRSMNPNL